MKPVDLRSDTVTRPGPGMRKAMYEAEVGDDGYGEDPTVRRLQEKCAELLGKEAALFVPSGTMANQICLRLLACQGEEVICDSGAHLYRKEGAAASALWGLSFLAIDANRGILHPEQVRRAMPGPKINHPVSRVLALENTNAHWSGSYYRLEEVEALRGLSTGAGLKIHMDGARLFNACVAGGYLPAEVAALCDTICFCLSKGLGAPVGSVLAASKDNIAQAARLRKMLGGGMRQIGSLAAAGLYALGHNLDRLKEDHARAICLAQGLAAIPGVSLDPGLVVSNIVNFTLDFSEAEAARFARAAKDDGILLKSGGHARFRAVTHLDIGDDDIHRALGVISRLMKEMTRA